MSISSAFATCGVAIVAAAIAQPEAVRQVAHRAFALLLHGLLA